ncbi:MAG TPA: class I SAM-dependent methyltransferase [Elusimicrobiota bacterium]|nr:class I SAM-dependent methyltransferase [Elusimicrobiota bacterium]
MPALIRIPTSWLAQTAQTTRDDVFLYYRGFAPARWFMWRRLEHFARLIARHPAVGGRALDVGGGLGILLPTLAREFSSVTMLDLDIRLARKVCERFQLSSVRLVEGDILSVADFQGRFDAITAAAFLEHFQDSDRVISRLKTILRPGGLLFVDLPTENGLYRLGRRIGRITKPADHYHGAMEIRDVLLRHFSLVEEQFIPCRRLALFYQAALAAQAS